MADRIKGIVVEIGGDTTKLSAAMKKVNSSIGSTKSQLKDVERLLKLDPKNTELLAQKHRLLGQAVGETKDKLKTLKEASEAAAKTRGNYDAFQAAFTPIQAEIDKTGDTLKALKKQMKEAAETEGPDSEKYKSLETQVKETEAKVKDLKAQGEACRKEFGNPVSTEQWEGLQREIFETEQQLKSLEDQAAHSNVLLNQISYFTGQAGDALHKAGGAVTDVGKKMLPATTAIVGVGTASVKTAADFDTAMSKVKALSGATESEYERLREAAKEAGKTTAFSASEAADALGFMALAGWNTNQSITALPAVLNLAAAAEMDLGAASDMVTDYLSAFGMGASEAAYFTDLLAYAQANSNTSAAQLGDAYKNCAASLNAAGQDVETVTSLLEAMANQGLKGGEAGTALSAIMRDITAKMDKGAISIGKTKIAVQDADGNFRDLTDILMDVAAATDGMGDAQRAAALSSTFTSDSMKGLNMIYNEGMDKVAGYEEALRGAGGTAQETADTMLDNLNGQLTTLSSQIEGVAINIGEVLMPYISDLVEKVSEAVDWFSNLDEGQQKMVMTIALVVAALGPAIMILGQVISAVGSISDGISWLAANPIALLIAVIVAVVALIATKGDEIQALLQKVDDFLQGVFLKDWTEVFGPGLGDILNGFFANLKNIWDSIKQIFDGIIDFIRGVFTGDWERAWTGVQEIFSGVFSGLATIVKAPLNGIIALLNGAISGINRLIGGLNGIGFKLPDWLGGGSFKINIPQIGKIPYLAKGGSLSGGSAIVGEAGPELLTVGNGRAVVQPLSGNYGHIESLLGDISGKLGGGQSGPIVIQVTLDGRIVGQAVYDYIGNRGRANGS